MDYREEFLQIFRQHVTRPGSEKLLDWLDDYDDTQEVYHDAELPEEEEEE